MCRGLALGWNFKEGIVCKGSSHHSHTLKNEDDYIKMELIITDKNKDGYLLTLDERYSKDNIKKEELKNCFTVNGKLKKSVFKQIYEEIKKDEIIYLRWLLHNRAYAEVKGDCNNSYQRVKGYCNNSCQKVKANCNNSFQEVEGDCNNYFQKVKGNCYNYAQKVGGNCNNSCQKVKGDCNNSHQKVKGEIFINNIKNYDDEIDSFIEKLTKENDNKLTWKILVRLAMEGCKNDNK